MQHWRLHRADWEAFQQFCEESLTISQFENEEGVDDSIALFTAKLNNIAEKNIPKTSTVLRKIDKPWFDRGCRKAIDKTVFHLALSNMAQRHVAFRERHVALHVRHVALLECHVALQVRHVALQVRRVALLIFRQ